MNLRPPGDAARDPRPRPNHPSRVAALLTPAGEAAAVLGVSRQRVQQLIAAGRLEPLRLGGRLFVTTLSLEELRLARARRPRRPAAAAPRTRPRTAQT